MIGGGAIGAALAALVAPQLASLGEPSPPAVALLNVLWEQAGALKSIFITGIGCACLLAALVCGGVFVFELLGGDTSQVWDAAMTRRAENQETERLKAERKRRRAEPWAYDAEGTRRTFNRKHRIWEGTEKEWSDAYDAMMRDALDD